MYIVYGVGHYDSRLKIVSAVHHVDQLGVLDADVWASEAVSEQN